MARISVTRRQLVFAAIAGPLLGIAATAIGIALQSGSASQREVEAAVSRSRDRLSQADAAFRAHFSGRGFGIDFGSIRSKSAVAENLSQLRSDSAFLMDYRHELEFADEEVRAMIRSDADRRAVEGYYRNFDEALGFANAALMYAGNAERLLHFLEVADWTHDGTSLVLNTEEDASNYDALQDAVDSSWAELRRRQALMRQQR